MVLISILLAVVILYNLTNINVAERIRELSTIKVLGFHNKEVTLYIYRETIILSVIGMAVGLLGGFFLHRFLIEKVAPSIISLTPLYTTASEGRICWKRSSLLINFKKHFKAFPRL